MSLNNVIFSFRSSASAIVYSRVRALPIYLKVGILTTHATDLRSEGALCSLRCPFGSYNSQSTPI